MRPLKDLIILRQAMGALEHAKNRMCIAQPESEPVSSQSLDPLAVFAIEVEMGAWHPDEMAERAAIALKQSKWEVPPPQPVAYVPLTAETVFKVARKFKHIATLVPHVEVGEFAKAIERAVHGEPDPVDAATQCQDARLFVVADDQGKQETCYTYNPADFSVSTFPTQDGWFATHKGVKVTHTPTGMAVECSTERGQHANRQSA